MEIHVTNNSLFLRKKKMIHETIILGTEPYLVFINQNTEYPMHTHHEPEFVYCISGKIRANVEGIVYEINEGEAICFNSMIRHGFEVNTSYAEQMVIEFGHAFIGEEFLLLKNANFTSRIYREGSPGAQTLASIRNILCAKKSEKATSSLLIKSELYKLFVDLVEYRPSEDNDISIANDLHDRDTSWKIDNAISLIHHRYNETIKVSDAALACGYSTGVFCSVFKKATGTSFHSYLNAYRIEKAKYILKSTVFPLEQIADSVGFADAKSFCRVFKQNIGMSPGKYRKSKTVF